MNIYNLPMNHLFIFKPSFFQRSTANHIGVEPFYQGAILGLLLIYKVHVFLVAVRYSGQNALSRPENSGRQFFVSSV